MLQKPYPNQVVVHDTMRYVSWSTEELREAMREDKSIESAVHYRVEHTPDTAGQSRLRAA